MKSSLVWIVLCLFSYTVSAASILYSKGEVLLDSKSASSGDAISAGQTVETKEGAMAILDLDGGSKFKLEANSKVVLSNLNHPQKGTLLDLVRGNILIKARKIKEKSDLLKVNAKQVALGVRGTLFFVGIDDSEGREDVWMCVEHGEVLVKGKSDKSLTKVRAKEGVVVRDAKNSSKPTFFPWTSKINWELEDREKISSNENALKEAYLNPLRRNYD